MLIDEILKSLNAHDIYKFTRDQKEIGYGIRINHLPESEPKEDLKRYISILLNKNKTENEKKANASIGYIVDSFFKDFIEKVSEIGDAFIYENNMFIVFNKKISLKEKAEKLYNERGEGKTAITLSLKCKSCDLI